MSTKNTDEQADNPERAGDERSKSKARSARRRENRKAHADVEQETGAKPVANAHEADVAPQARGQGAAGFTAVLALLVALAAAAYTGWQGYQLQRQSQQLDTEVASRLREIETIGSNSRQLSNDAKNVASDVEARIGQLDARLAGLENQRLAMESLYNDLSRSRDEWTLTQVEQILLVASQQLQLADNVKAALVALQAADARLAKSERPQFTQLRRVIEADIERLKSSPFVDVTG
ncbi:MAG: uroporphyrinogen-III C-methyltransferase, partial [Burkholderiales bacterium]